MTENLAPRASAEKTPELEINPRSVAITAITFYPNWYPGEVQGNADTDKIRGDLALESIRKAKQIGYQAVIADGPSSPAFKDNLAGLGVEVLERDKMQRAVGGRQTIERASTLDEVRVILRTELEKVSLVEDCVSLIAQPILEGRADIVVPKRNEELYVETYPDYMHASETKGRRLFNNLMHKVGLLPEDQTLEFLFGAVALSNDPNILALFMEQYAFQGPRVGGWKYIEPEEWSDIQLFPIVKALYLGYRVEGVEVPFRYPLKQRENEELNRDNFAEKRKQQRMGLISELIQFLRTLSTDPKIRGKGKLIPLHTVEEPKS